MPSLLPTCSGWRKSNHSHLFSLFSRKCLFVPCFLQEAGPLQGGLVCSLWRWPLPALYARPCAGRGSTGCCPSLLGTGPSARGVSLNTVLITLFWCLSFFVCTMGLPHRVVGIRQNRIFRSLHMKYVVDKMQAFIIIGLSCYLGCPMLFDEYF